MPRASMGGSTIRTAAGKAADCGARTATARPGSRKAARAQCRVPCTSSFGPIRWRTEVRREYRNGQAALLQRAYRHASRSRVTAAVYFRHFETSYFGAYDGSVGLAAQEGRDI